MGEIDIMFTVIANSTPTDAVIVNKNFYHVGREHLLPRSSVTLLPTSSVYDLGSSTATWANIYADNTYISGSTTFYNTMNLLTEITVTNTSSSIDFTGLNSSDNHFYEIKCRIIGTNSFTAGMIFNNDNSGHYGQQIVQSIDDTTTTLNATSITSIPVGQVHYVTTTAGYSKFELMIYIGGPRALVFTEGGDNHSSDRVGSFVQGAYSWESDSTVTSIKFITDTTTGYFSPGTNIQIWGRRGAYG